MKSASVLLAVCVLSFVASGSPLHLFGDIPEAMTIGEGGWSNFSLQITDDGPALRLGRALGRRIDAFAVVTPRDPLNLGLRALLLKDVGPLNAVLTVAWEKIGLISGLRLGPVHLDWGREFGVGSLCWGILSAFPDQRVGVILGLKWRAGKADPLFGIRLFPQSGLRGVSLLVRPEGFSMTFGGTF